MKLKLLEINNYRSICYLKLPIDESITALVGANEHGKTNLLCAIRLLDFKTQISDLDRRKLKKVGDRAKDTYVKYYLELFSDEMEEFYSFIIENSPQQKTLEQQDGNEIKASVKIEIPQELQLKISYKDGNSNNYEIVSLNDDLLINEEQVLKYIRQKLSGKIFYFDTFAEYLKPKITKDEIVNKKNEITNGLVKLADLKGNENNIFIDTSDSRSLLRQGEENLSNELKKLWIQGKEDSVEVKLDVNFGTNTLSVDIEDFNTFGEVSTRSRGFIFFLSFILKFREYHDGDLKNYILLIEEPGIFLHPRGQKDLLLYLNKLSIHNQLIYSTHSPFILNRLRPFSIRVVSKTIEKGTEVDCKPYIHNWKPLRTSLGVFLSDSFYYAENNLIVEGPSERLYIIAMLEYLIGKKVLSADLNILSIIDAGCCDNVPAMYQILQSEERPSIVLIDSDQKGDRVKPKIVKKGIDKDKLKQIGDFKSNAKTIEDLLPRKLIIMAINNYIKEMLKDGFLTEKKINPEKSDNKPEKQPGPFTCNNDTAIINQLKEYLKDNYEQDEISKLNIARHFEDLLMDSNNNLSDIETSNFLEMSKWIVHELEIGIE